MAGAGLTLAYDPAGGPAFWQAVSQIPGFPHGERIRLSRMVFESGALHRLPLLVWEAGADPAAPLLVVMDPTPMRRGTDSLKPLLLEVLRTAGWSPEPLVLPPGSDGQVHTTMEQIERVQAHLSRQTAVLSAGSGVVTDVAKHACHLFEQQAGCEIPFVVFQTANSVSAYTSNMAPVSVHGVKRTLPSRYPDLLVCDLETLRDAPYAMTAAGAGDMLAALVSLPDWYLAHSLGMDETYTELPARLVGRLDEVLLAAAPHIRQRTLEGMALLAKLISLGGLAMSLSHATTPMSGYEHVISHALDLRAEAAGRPLAVHGSQAALSALLGCQAYQFLFQQLDPAAVDLPACFPSPQEMKAAVFSAFTPLYPSGDAAAECWADYLLKLERWQGSRAAVEQFLAGWNELKTRLQALTCPPQRLLQVLQALGAPQRFSELDPPAGSAQVEWAFLHAPLMRRRLTVGDLLIFFDLDRRRLWRQISSAGWL